MYQADINRARSLSTILNLTYSCTHMYSYEATSLLGYMIRRDGARDL